MHLVHLCVVVQWSLYGGGERRRAFMVQESDDVSITTAVILVER